MTRDPLDVLLAVLGLAGLMWVGAMLTRIAVALEALQGCR